MSRLAAVRDIRDAVSLPSIDELEQLETDLLAQFVIARSGSGVSDQTVRSDIHHLDWLRGWLGRPLWTMTPEDADRYFATALRNASMGTHHGRATTIRCFFRYLELRHKGEIHRLTGHVVACPVDEINAPRGKLEQKIRVPPAADEIEHLFSGWRSDLATVRRFATAARTFAAARLMAEVGLRINELRMLDLDDIHPELGAFGKLHVRYAKGSNGSGPRTRFVPLINGADPQLRWYVEDIRGMFDDAGHWDRPGAPLFPSERHHPDGSATRVAGGTLRDGLHDAVARHLPSWQTTLTPHMLRHFCASQLYLAGMDIIAVQELLGHKWLATTMTYVHVHRGYIDDAWKAAERRAAARLGGPHR